MTQRPLLLKKVAIFVVALGLVCVKLSAHPKPKPHYTFVLPDGYIGWVQIIFNDPQASPLPIRDDGGRVIEVPESGIPRTSDIRVHDDPDLDIFYYRTTLPTGASLLRPMPPQLILVGEGHGGWGVMDTGGKGVGYSWFIFFGPPDIRANTPDADVSRMPRTHKKLMAPDVYPTPGRLPDSPPAKP